MVYKRLIFAGMLAGGQVDAIPNAFLTKQNAAAYENKVASLQAENSDIEKSNEDLTGSDYRHVTFAMTPDGSKGVGASVGCSFLKYGTVMEVDWSRMWRVTNDSDFWDFRGRNSLRRTDSFSSSRDRSGTFWYNIAISEDGNRLAVVPWRFRHWKDDVTDCYVYNLFSSNDWWPCGPGQVHLSSDSGKTWSTREVKARVTL